MTRPSSLNISLMRECAGISHIGLTRRRNEDALIIAPLHATAFLLAVADGLGGGARGQEAAHLVTELLCETDLSQDAPLDALQLQLQKANMEILSRRSAGATGMGATVTAAVVTPVAFHWIHAGDSRLYHYYGGRLEQLTQDHRALQEFVASGEMTQEEAEKHPLRNHITQCVGAPHLAPDTGSSPITAHTHDEYLLLCTDGLHDSLSLKTMETILRYASGPQNAVQALIRGALKARTTDNASCIATRLSPLLFSDLQTLVDNSENPTI